MSQTLGEKLRQAREERGISLTEVAEQTRISPQYIEAIERDDYKPLPGGIFNKGFVKSFAKYVGVDENEALADYLNIIAEKEDQNDEDLKTYKPEVLTDDYSSRSMIPTILGAVIILGLMTAGILYFLQYRNESPQPVANTNTNANSSNSNTALPDTANAGPEMTTVKVEFKADQQPVPLSATSDGLRSETVVVAGSAKVFEPKESLTVNYNKWNADKIQLSINGKSISLPAVPLNPQDKRIEFTIDKSNLARIFNTGAVSVDVPAATIVPKANSAPANTGVPASTPLVPTRQPPVVKPTVTSNTSAPPIRTNPTPKPTVTGVPMANRPR